MTGKRDAQKGKLKNNMAGKQQKHTIFKIPSLTLQISFHFNLNFCSDFLSIHPLGNLSLSNQKKNPSLVRYFLLDEYSYLICKKREFVSDSSLNKGLQELGLGQPAARIWAVKPGLPCGVAATQILLSSLATSQDVQQQHKLESGAEPESNPSTLTGMEYRHSNLALTSTAMLRQKEYFIPQAQRKTGTQMLAYHCSTEMPSLPQMVHVKNAVERCSGVRQAQ